jgi:hypothetical protein
LTWVSAENEITAMARDPQEVFAPSAMGIILVHRHSIPGPSAAADEGPGAPSLCLGMDTGHQQTGAYCRRTGAAPRDDIGLNLSELRLGELLSDASYARLLQVIGLGHSTDLPVTGCG